ncbi:hypothetical protein D3C77_697650 [compost metagenome]
MVLAQLAGETRMTGAQRPLLHLRRAVVLRAHAAHRLLEQGEQGRDMALIQGNDAIEVRV